MPQTYYPTINKTLAPGARDTVKQQYVVPPKDLYYVDAIAYMLCDSALVNYKTDVMECVNTNDLALLTFVKPDGSQDEIGSSKDITVIAKNLSSALDYEDVIIRAWIEDVNGNRVQDEIQGLLPRLEPGDETFYTFPLPYKVPNLDYYVIRVFITKVDDYQDNDTIKTAHRETKIVGITSVGFDKFVLGQNTPNPAKQNTMIEYSIPSSGEIVFNVHSVSGQLLHTQTLQSESGKHFIELNTSDFAAGVYFYSMEYKGQKLVKRMSVKK